MGTLSKQILHMATIMVAITMSPSIEMALNVHLPIVEVPKYLMLYAWCKHNRYLNASHMQ